MQFVKKIFLLTLLLFAVGCGIYQSEGRKQFESQVQPSQFGIGFDHLTENCKNTPNLKAWLFLEQLPNESELEFSSGKLEIWKSESTDKTSINIQTVIPQSSTTMVCQHHFENLMSWSEIKEQFIQEALRAYDESQTL